MVTLNTLQHNCLTVNLIDSFCRAHGSSLRTARDCSSLNLSGSFQCDRCFWDSFARSFRPSPLFRVR